MIYHHAFVSGYTAILCTSRGVYNEALNILYKSAFLHIYYEGVINTGPLNPAQPVTAVPISTKIMPLIQNLDICVDFGLPGFWEFSLSTGLLASIQSADAPPRQTCILSLKEIEPALNLNKVAAFLRDTRLLINFQRVYVTALTRILTRGLLTGRALPDYDVDAKAYYLLTRARSIPVYKLAKKELEASLGPSIWRDGKKESDRCLEFHPLVYRKSLRDAPLQD